MKGFPIFNEIWGMIARVKVTIVPFIQNAQKTITDKMVWDAERHDEEAGKKISSSFGRISISLILLIYNFFHISYYMSKFH